MATFGEVLVIIEKAWREKEERKVWADIILRCLRLRFGYAPEDVTKSLYACWELERLRTSLDASVTEGSLDDFRRLTGL
jgi:hypothetical protein